MRRASVILSCAAAIVLASCSREEGLRCEDTSQYATSTSIPPIRVPDDLNVPDESGSLLIPGPAAQPEGVVATECLETPPDYYENDDAE
jgi:uncharacterized lipoprotein